MRVVVAASLSLACRGPELQLPLNGTPWVRRAAPMCDVQNQRVVVARVVNSWRCSRVRLRALARVSLRVRVTRTRTGPRRSPAIVE